MQISNTTTLNLDGLGARLRHERARLGWNQQTMADKAGITRITQSRYERGETYPDLVYLNALVREGLNFWYVCCGDIKRNDSPSGQ